MKSINFSTTPTLALGLGANIPSKIGSPQETLCAVRPELEKTIQEWIVASFPNKKNIGFLNDDLFSWSPLFETQAMGGPPGQPSFINAVLVIMGPQFAQLEPNEQAALELLQRCLILEKHFGRKREQSTSSHWGPRSLDLDLLAWGGLHVATKSLTLPHPRLIERSFVLVPLNAAITKTKPMHRQIPPCRNWPE
ncbi:2-amino-4-hydroxy-6-hydroxymethyldihydropteridine diphosphokinase [Prochlorococcus sp. MIT 1300]|uniref:2-amino-4-hydroxy-6- hydroxymethyldihydropteridine diphosphokinase n=1 Tax=Prochlorococcus sp. MIT 1300 TaxID=3096218 RepID=UPI002A74E967|nr:2-amino-4-hydroxy-6-hydroxymethyldihydropteridine diphosphokinase [Prochlorococcus sp. MIT 1300]